MSDTYKDCTLKLKLVSENSVTGDLHTMQKLLNKFGVQLSIVSNEAILHIDSLDYTREKTRHAGTKHKDAHKSDGSLLTYGDVLYWNRGEYIVWDDIVKLTDISRTSFYSRKKAMEADPDFQTLMDALDWNQVHDKKHWETLPFFDKPF